VTYEPQPGELVLVRGEIRGKHTRNIDEILGWTVLVVNEVDGENYIDVRAADVVGPATPTAGEDDPANTETWWARAMGAEMALRVAETERDALQTRIDAAFLALDAWGPIEDADEDVRAVYAALTAPTEGDGPKTYTTGFDRPVVWPAPTKGDGDE